MDLQRFLPDQTGGVAIFFGLSALTLAGIVGSGLDLSMLQRERQIAGNALALTCQFVTKSPGTLTEQQKEREARRFFEVNHQLQRTNPPTVTFQINPDPDDAGKVVLNAQGQVPTTFMSMIGVSSMPFSTQIHCRLPSAGSGSDTAQSSPGEPLLRETFESGEARSNTFWMYVKNYNGWTTSGEGVELSAGYKQGAPEGRNVGELVAERSIAMTRKVRLRAGTYELRYWYAGAPYLRTQAYHTEYDPAPICANNAVDVAWATADPTQPSRMAVYLSADSPGWSMNWMGLYPTDPSWRPSDLLETCIYAASWVERSITINIQSTGDYWLTFAGQSRNGAPEGAQIDDIRLCPNRCEGERRLAPHERPGTVLYQDNFTWAQVGCCSIDLSSRWPAYPERHEVWTTDYYPTRPSLGKFHMVDMDNAQNVTLGRRMLLPAGDYELRYTYTARIKFPGIADVATCGPSRDAPNIRGFPSGRDIAESGDWQRVTRNYNTNAMAVFFDPENGPNRSLPSQIVDYCIYGGAPTEPVRRSVRLRLTRPDFYRLTFRGEGESDSVGALLSNVMICAVTCDSSSASSNVVAIR